MITKLAAYTLKNEKDLETVHSAIADFVQAIRENEPNTRYDTYQVKDSVSFYHFMQFADTQAEKNHKDADYTKKFVEVLYPLCEKEPEFTDLETLA